MLFAVDDVFVVLSMIFLRRPEGQGLGYMSNITEQLAVSEWTRAQLLMGESTGSRVLLSDRIVVRERGSMGLKTTIRRRESQPKLEGSEALFSSPLCDIIRHQLLEHFDLFRMLHHLRLQDFRTRLQCLVNPFLESTVDDRVVWYVRVGREGYRWANGAIL